MFRTGVDPARLDTALAHEYLPRPPHPAAGVPRAVLEHGRSAGD